MRNHLFLWKLCFKAAPRYMIFFIYDAFRYQFVIFLEHTLGIGYVLYCAEHGEPFYKAFIGIGLVLLINMIQIVPDGYFIHGMTYRSKPKLYKALTEKMYEKAAQLDLSCYDDPKYYNDFVLAVSEATSSIDRFLKMLNSSVQSITIIITTGIFFLLTDAAGILFVLASFILSFLFSKAINKLKLEIRMKVNPWERKRNYASRVFYLNDYAKELRLNKEVGKILKEDFTEANEQIEIEQRKISRKRVTLQFLRYYCAGDFITDGLYVGYLIIQAAVLHRIDYSSAVVLFNRTGSLRSAMRGIAEIGPQINENNLFLEKIMKFLSYEPELKHNIGANVPMTTGKIEMQHVSFRYTAESPEILHDINMVVNPGERIAIVGYNGAGKTTLIKLLMRLYDPTEGCVLYHDKNVKEYNLDEYHSRIGVVFQDYRMFGENLLENVVLDDPRNMEHIDDSASGQETKVIDALDRSGFHERLESLPKGLDTPITTEFDEKGVNLSGGESQKVAIARAFFRDADILAMDEPSSALDPIAEYNLNKAMHEAAENKTVFYISHRLSTTRDADRIIMLEHGRIIEEGTHDELLQANGKYSEMWNAQAGRYL